MGGGIALFTHGGTISGLCDMYMGMRCVCGAHLPCAEVAPGAVGILVVRGVDLCSGTPRTVDHRRAALGSVAARNEVNQCTPVGGGMTVHLS